MTDVRCTWSDLRPDECEHCGAHPGSTIVLEPPRAEVESATASTTARRRLPILSAAEHGTPDIHDMIDELTRAHGHRERYTANRGTETWNAQHITEVPSLVDQLLGATPGGSKDEAGSGGAKSKPAARIEAIDTLMLIDDEAARWVRRLGEDDPGDKTDPKTGRRIPGSGTIACLQLLHGLHASQDHCGRERPHRTTSGRPDCCTKHTIEHDVRRWWHQARVISGWDSPAWRPNNTCPICEQRQALRVNLMHQTAMCIECRSVWGTDEIGLLAEHIRRENAEDGEDTPDVPA